MSKLRIGQATCPYCGYVTTTGGISTHVRHCSKNPDMIAKKRQKVIPTEVALDSLPAHLRDLIHPTDTGKEVPKVICLCGSTRFAEWFMIKRWELEKQGIITFGINILPNNYFAEGNSHGAEQEGVKEILDNLHCRKIDLSDEVFVLNVGGYIGESTRNEINYAESINKPIKYLEPLNQTP